MIRLNNDGAKVKYGEAAEEIDATLCDIDIYSKDIKRTKSVVQCTNSGVGGVTKGAAAGISTVRQQDDEVYSVAGLIFNVASNSLQNSIEKTFSYLGLVGGKFQKFIHACWSA